jgi:hypothetical protein
VSRLQHKLTSRQLHPYLLKYCRTELLQNNYFHAVLETTKSIASMIRFKTGLISDVARLIDEAFGRYEFLDFKKKLEKGIRSALFVAQRKSLKHIILILSIGLLMKSLMIKMGFYCAKDFIQYFIKSLDMVVILKNNLRNFI